MGDALAFLHVQVAWGRSIGDPLQVLWLGLTSPGLERVSAVVGLASLVMSAWLLWRKEYEFGAFLMFATIIPVSEGLLSLPRFVFWQMPFMYGIVRLLHGRRWLETLWFALAGGFAVLMLIGWFAGRAFVL
jgi:hypothetical protein